MLDDSAKPAPNPPASTPAPEARTPGFRPTTLPGVRGTAGAVLLGAFILMLVSAILAIVFALQNIGVRTLLAESVVTLILGLMVAFCAFLVWQGRNETGGIFAVVAGIVFLVLGPETAGLMAVLGGILAIIARRVPEFTA